MTLVKWQPAHSLVSDFDQMINSIFNDETTSFAKLLNLACLGRSVPV